MFELQDVVENTAFFRRTTAPTMDPTGDGREKQRLISVSSRGIPAEAVVRAHTGPSGAASLIIWILARTGRESSLQAASLRVRSISR